MTVAGNAHVIYMKLDDSLRRIANQAFFERVNVYEVEDADIVGADEGEPFDVLFDPALHVGALAYEARVQGGEDVQIAHVEGLNISSWVDLPGRFSNTRPALRTLISRVLKGSEGRGPRSRAPDRRDTRGPVVKDPAKSQTGLSPEKRAELVAAYQAGEPVLTIAARFGVHRATMSEFVRQAGVAAREHGLDAAVRARAAALYESGLTLAQVADEVAASVETVRPRCSQRAAPSVRRDGCPV